jgi:hypothetical protein
MDTFCTFYRDQLRTKYRRQKQDKQRNFYTNKRRIYLLLHSSFHVSFLNYSSPTALLRTAYGTVLIKLPSCGVKIHCSFFPPLI